MFYVFRICMLLKLVSHGSNVILNEVSFENLINLELKTLPNAATQTNYNKVKLWHRSKAFHTKPPTIEPFCPFIKLFFFCSVSLNTEKNTADVKVMGDFVDRDGERYLKITGFNVKPMNLSDFKLKMNGLFPDETMSELYKIECFSFFFLNFF